MTLPRAYVSDVLRRHDGWYFTVQLPGEDDKRVYNRYDFDEAVIDRSTLIMGLVKRGYIAADENGPNELSLYDLIGPALERTVTIR